MRFRPVIQQGNFIYVSIISPKLVKTQPLLPFSPIFFLCFVLLIWSELEAPQLITASTVSGGIAMFGPFP